MSFFPSTPLLPRKSNLISTLVFPKAARANGEVNPCTIPTAVERIAVVGETDKICEAMNEGNLWGEMGKYLEMSRFPTFSEVTE